jgi:anti-sigma factor RsiW
MAEKHPSELELLSFVEEELDDGARRDLAEHLVVCRSCADQIRRLEAGRSALRAAPLLELPDDRRAEILAALPERPDPWRLFRPVKRALVVAAPVAGAAALIAVFVLAGTQLGGGGGDDDAASGDAAEATMLEDAGGGAEEAAPERVIPEGATLVRTAQGPAAEIVRLLELQGITARVDAAGAVEADALAAAVEDALADRPEGDVPVYVR